MNYSDKYILLNYNKTKNKFLEKYGDSKILDAAVPLLIIFVGLLFQGI